MGRTWPPRRELLAERTGGLPCRSVSAFHGQATVRVPRAQAYTLHRSNRMAMPLRETAAPDVFEPRVLVAAAIRQPVAPLTALGPAREYGVAARTEAASIFDKASNNGLRVGYELAAEPENVREASLLVARGSAIDNSAHGLRLA
jgi:hypothetical protein